MKHKYILAKKKNKKPKAPIAKSNDNRKYNQSGAAIEKSVKIISRFKCKDEEIKFKLQLINQMKKC